MKAHSRIAGNRTFFAAIVSFAMMLTLFVAVPTTPAHSRVRSIPPVADNPDLTKACGLNVLMILDESGSIDSSHATNDVRNAFKAFTDALKNTSSAMAIAEFSKVARLPTIGSFSPGEYITITNATKADMDDYIDNDYNPGGNTNWEDGLRMGNPNFAARPNHQVPHLTVVITDGDPTQMIRNDRVTPDEYLNKVPLADSETQSAGKNEGADHAIANANGIKAQDSHILVIAVGDGVSGSSSLNRLEKISGPDVYDGSGTFDITTDDIYREEDFSKLEDALRETAFQLCSPSVTVQKFVDLTPDPDSLGDAIAGVGWEIEGAVTAPGSGEYDWVLPVAEAPATGPKTAATDGAGFATFQWLPTDEVGDSTFSATETVQPGFTNDQSHTTCTFRTPDSPDAPLPITVAEGTFTGSIPSQSIVTCQFVNIADPAPSVTIDKATNGADADSPPGPSIPVGDPVDWTYTVTNTGNTRLDGVSVVDDQGVTVTCPQTSLTHGQSMTCTASGTATAGQYANVGSVFATDSHGTLVSDTDPSHYFGDQPGIDIEKATNGSDADNAPGPLVAPNSTVTWSYVVTNTSATFDIGSIAVVDETHIEGDASVNPPASVGVTCPSTTLAAGASMTCTARTGTAVPGQYENLARVTGIADPGGSDIAVSDSDPSHYFAVAADIDVEKLTNGEDADTPTGPQIPVGDPVLWTYEVTNTGNFPLTSWEVSDDKLGPIACPRVILLPGATATCSATGSAVSGQYSNLATATATDPLGISNPTDTDPSHYFGLESALTLEKHTNGEDADSPTGPYITPGDAVSWTYIVTNQGNSTLTGITVTDSKGVTVSCPKTTLIPGESMTCTASGIAVAGQYRNLGLAVGYDPLQQVRADLDPSHYFGAVPGISVEKLTNGVDADTAPGPYIPEGDAVDWTYIITNTGNDSLNTISLTDDQLGPITCPGSTLAVGASMTCTASGTATIGQYSNLATVTAVDSAGSPASDEDPSHYFGYISEIAIEKSTNGDDADTPTGPLVPVGNTVTWTYEITNNGNIDIHNPVVTDDQGVTPVFIGGDNGDGLLNPTETWTYSAVGTAVAGQYGNLGSVDALDALEEPVNDTDPSHYFGSEASIDIEKATNTEDADAAPGPRILVGDPVNWTYEVENTGNVDLTGVAVIDDQGVAVTCPQTTLTAGESMTCTASGTATVGQYKNLGSVTGAPPVGSAVTDSDPSHYFGSHPEITIEKTTNGVDADIPTGPYIPDGDPVSWEYVVTNTGNTILDNVVVTDDQGVTVTCTFPLGAPLLIPVPTLDTATCTATGTATVGQYANIGSVVANDTATSTSVTDVDPSHYFGSAPAITIKKWTNGKDADTPTGPYIPVGDAAAWTYFVSAAGNVPLTNVNVTDDQGVTPVFVPASDTNTNGVLDIGEIWVYMASAAATSGQYENTGTATGQGPAGTVVTDDDLSHYFGATPGIEIEKSTNGDDADTPTGPYISAGDTVTWEYVVTNIGNIALESVAVTDNQGVTVTCPQDTLAVAESITCSASAPAIDGQYANVGSVTATDLAGTDVSDDDPSHYFGAEPSIIIEKWTNGEDADTPTGPYIPVGDDVEWAYLVYTLGNVPLSNIVVTDDQGVTPIYLIGDTNTDGILDPLELWVYGAVGIAADGQYANIGTATGTPPGGLAAVTDTDPSHYFGLDASIDIEKTPDLTYVQLGEPHTFTITVTNTSNVDLTGVAVTDPLVSACDADLGTMTPGQVITYDCTVDSVTTVINNIADVAGTAPNAATVTDTDNALVGPWSIAGTATIGDTVWQDENKNGVQDAGEPGIAGARVDVHWLDGSTGVQTYTTDTNGHYLAVGLVEGNYRVELDMTSVNSELTTPGAYTFFLASGEERLDADFGIFETLPVTGSETDRIALIGLMLLLIGVIALQVARRKQN